jgi:hypothetical protein
MAIKQSMNRWEYDLILVAVLFLTTTWLTGCAIFFPHRDPTTYNNLIELKAEALALVETFDAMPFDSNEAAIVDYAMKFQKAYVYEKGHGKRNSDTMWQLDGIWSLLSEDIAVYREDGNAAPGPNHFHEAAIILGKPSTVPWQPQNKWAKAGNVSRKT